MYGGKTCISGEMGGVVFLWPALITLVVSFASPRWWIPALRRWGVVDMPNARSSHRLPTIRGAGLAPASGVLSGLLMGVMLTGQETSLLPLCVLFGAPIAMALLGLAEDIKGVPIVARAIAQLVIGLIQAAALCVLLDRSLLWILPLALAIAGYVNVANFMDGVNGMSVLHGLVSGSYFVVVGLVIDQASISIAGVVTAAAFIGFAPWNLVRGRVFLGDVGSYLLGALVVGCGVAVFLVGGSVLIAIAPGLPYLADTGLTFFRRARNGERVFEAHRSHVYQQLTDEGWSHLASSATVAGATTLCCGAALWTTHGDLSVPGGVLLMMLVLTGYLTAPLWAVRVRGKVSA